MTPPRAERTNVTNWQTIDNAPKDGTQILVWPSIWSNQDWDVARFDDDKYASRPRPFWRRTSPAGMRECRENVPTHWLRPSPPLPIDRAAEDGMT